MEVPESVRNLKNLETVSLEWFYYQNPPQKIMNGDEFRASLKNGCNFVDFLCNRNNYHQKLSEIRFKAMKGRCVIQAMCSNKHLHLLKHILNDSRMHNYDFNIRDKNG